MINPFFLPSVSLHDRANLPTDPAVYFCTSGWSILYIGKAKNLYLRWNSPNYGNHHKLYELRNYPNVRLHVWRRPLWRLDHDEARMIKKHKPKLNRRNEPLVWWVSVYDWFMDSLKIGCAIVLLYAIWRACF